MAQLILKLNSTILLSDFYASIKGIKILEREKPIKKFRTIFPSF